MAKTTSTAKGASDGKQASSQDSESKLLNKFFIDGLKDNLYYLYKSFYFKGKILNIFFYRASLLYKEYYKLWIIQAQRQFDNNNKIIILPILVSDMI